MRDFFTFDRLIIPPIIRCLQWLFLIVFPILMLILIAASADDGNPVIFVGGFFAFVAVFFFMRLIVEWFMLIFRISETVTDINSEAKRRTGTATMPGSRVGFQDFLSFRRMIMPSIIRAFFWASIALAILAVFVGPAVGAGIAGDFGADGGEAMAVYLGAMLVIAVLGAFAVFFVRIIAEVMVVAFNINKDFVEIKDVTTAASSHPSLTSSNKVTFQDFLVFRRMITPVWLKIWFWVLVGVVIVGSLVGYSTFLMGVIENPVGRFILMLVLMAFGLLIVRIIIEFSLVPFSINETIYELRLLIAAQVRSVGGTGRRTFLDFLTFRVMIAPYLIQVLYWVFTVGTLFLVSRFADYVMELFGWWIPAGIPAEIRIALLLVWLLLSIRLYAEQFLVLFKINENLTDIQIFAKQQASAAEANRPFAFGEYLLDLWAFRRMFTPILMQIAYWIFSVVVVFAGLSVAATAATVDSDEISLLGGWYLDFELNPGLIVFLALVGTVLALMFMRVIAEAFIVAFRVNDTLTDIRNTDRRHPIFSSAASPRIASPAPAATTAAMMACPYCAEVIPSQEVNCRYCGSALYAQPTATMPAAPAVQPTAPAPAAPAVQPTATMPAAPAVQHTAPAPAAAAVQPTAPAPAAPAVQPTAATTAMKVCPYCAEGIPSEETICRYCGSQLAN